MITLLLLIPMALVALLQLVAAIGIPGEARAHDLELPAYLASWTLYAVGFLGAVASVVLARGPLTLVVPLVAVTAAAVVAGPLVWGHAIGEFHLAHHLVRAALLVVVLVFYFWYVALHR
ncbi:hypothetical protein GCM10010922_20830 [Microbacterium sorbitolivorans]|uniref:Uncharacterized protein n=1 Tax=Microbacterium sorbitolivorans TaxID=1867410 RepID=A0A367Y7M6_9MICO|nr:hypothetical protein [Microbacterium sorbitolivorans]RCK61873.1 hypothetical protein DTO57_04465 [Microbacterium sorbitolivorans]GGF44965.1 hypothetical protein GCM10010922_20830 [Microbacterium sorbitolivorans]